MTPSAIGPPVRSHTSPTVQGTASLADFRRKAHARLAERIDPGRTRHKPLSLVRQDARRVVDRFVDLELPLLAREDRDRLVEDVVTESVWFGPLEELFREDAVREILVAGVDLVQVRRAADWTAVPVSFRDVAQLGAVLQWHVACGEPVVPAGESAVGHDVRLPNGFRLIVVAPPVTVGRGPMALYVRGPRPVAGSGPPRTHSGVIPAPVTRIEPAAPPPVEPAAVPGPPRPVAEPLGGRVVQSDPFLRTRQRITQRIIASFAAAGLTDLNVLPLVDLRRVVQAHVMEFCEDERLNYDEAIQERLALEILAGMNR